MDNRNQSILPNVIIQHKLKYPHKLQAAASNTDITLDDCHMKGPANVCALVISWILLFGRFSFLKVGPIIN